MWLMRIWGVRCSIYNYKSEMAMANDLAWRTRDCVISLTNAFSIASESMMRGEQGKRPNVCTFLDVSHWSYGFVPRFGQSPKLIIYIYIYEILDTQFLAFARIYLKKYYITKRSLDDVHHQL